MKKLQGNPFQSWTPRQVLSYAYAQKMSFKPGTSFNYSNTNTVLLGLLVQRLSGDSLPVYITRHILKPLHLDHTSFATSSRFPSPTGTPTRPRAGRRLTRPAGAPPGAGRPER